MKKSLLALAVLGAFAGAASAQSSVTVYGIVDLGFDRTDTGAVAGSTTGIKSGGQSASRIGFKGTEDLGGGLNALFQLEATIQADTGSAFSSPAVATSGVNAGYASGSGGFNRIATVGLQSAAFGTVNLGRQTSVIKDAYDVVDPFGDGGNIAPISAVFFGGALSGDFGRISNSVKYSTPSFGGFKASAAYSFGEAVGSTSDNSSYGFGLGYANGPLNVQFAYHNQERLAGRLPATISATSGVVTPGVAFVARENEAAFVGATYNFGGFKLHGAYADASVETATAETKVRNYLAGVSLPLGAAGNLFASYSVNDIRGTSNADSQRAAIMYTYDLSKRTNLYTGYSHTSNDDSVNLAGGPVGESNSAFNVGVRHKF